MGKIVNVVVVSIQSGCMFVGVFWRGVGAFVLTAVCPGSASLRLPTSHTRLVSDQWRYCGKGGKLDEFTATKQCCLFSNHHVINRGLRSEKQTMTSVIKSVDLCGYSQTDCHDFSPC